MKKFVKIASQILLTISIATCAFTAAADSPNVPPPRGHAYGYWLKDGARVMFFYVDEDGSRVITLSNAKPNAHYRVEVTKDMKSWTTLAQVVIGKDGTATCTDFAPEAYSFYQVIPMSKVF